MAKFTPKKLILVERFLMGLNYEESKHHFNQYFPDLDFELECQKIDEGGF